jgi:hypothetical protein
MFILMILKLSDEKTRNTTPQKIIFIVSLQKDVP